MPTSIDFRKQKCLDGLHYSFEILDYNYLTLYEQGVSIKSNSKNIVSALSKCWSIVDMTHRIREISQAIPDLNKKDRCLTQFLDKTKIVKDYRNYIQHLRNELSNESLNHPVWGSLSWVDPEDNSKSFTAIIGPLVVGTGYSGCVYDRIEGKWVSKVCLGIGGFSFNFDPIYDATITYRDFIIPWIQSNCKVGISITKHIPILSCKFSTNKQTSRAD